MCRTEVNQHSSGMRETPASAKTRLGTPASAHKECTEIYADRCVPAFPREPERLLHWCACVLPRPVTSLRGAGNATIDRLTRDWLLSRMCGPLSKIGSSCWGFCLTSFLPFPAYATGPRSERDPPVACGGLYPHLSRMPLVVAA